MEISQIIAAAASAITIIGAVVGALKWFKASIIREFHFMSSHLESKFEIRFSKIENALSHIEEKLDNLSDRFMDVEEDSVALDRRVIVLETIHEEQKSPKSIPVSTAPAIAMRRERRTRRGRQKTNLNP